MKKYHWKLKKSSAVAIAQFKPIQVDLSAYPETNDLNENRFHPRDQIPLNVGDVIMTLEELSGWYRGYVFSPSHPLNKPKLGIFPANHVVHIRKRQYKSTDPTYESHDALNEPDEVVQLDVGQEIYPIKSFQISGNPLPDPTYPIYITKYASEDPLIDQVTIVLRDWFNSLKQSLIKQDYKLYALIKKNVNNLLRGRRQLLAKKHQGQQLINARQDILNTIHEGNELLQFPQIIRDKETGLIITTKSSTIMCMHQSHTHLQWHVNPESKKQHKSFDIFDQDYLVKEDVQLQFQHVYLELKDFMQLDTFECHFQFVLRNGELLSETFIIQFINNKPQQTQFLLSHLSPSDIQLDTLLIAKVYKREPFSDKCLETNVKRPIGCLLLETMNILNGKETQPTNGYHCKYYPAQSDQAFGNYPFKCLTDHPTSTNSLSFIIKTVQGPLSTIQSPSMIIVNRIHFPSLITPELHRNKIHIQLVKGDFKSTNSKNVEIAFQLRNNYTGQLIDHAMNSGRGITNQPIYESSLHYHCTTPIYNESFTVDCPIDIMNDSHIYIAIRQLNTTDKERKETKMIGFSCIPLKSINGLKELTIYKYEKSKTAPGTYLTLPMDIIEKQDSLTLNIIQSTSHVPTSLNLIQYLNKQAPLDIQKVQVHELLFLMPDIFNIIVNNCTNDNIALLIYIIQLIQDVKYTTFDLNIQAYINSYKGPELNQMMVYLIQLLNNPDPSLHHVKQVRNTLKSSHYLLRLIFKSRNQLELKEIDVEFLKCIHHMLDIDHIATTQIIQYAHLILMEFKQFPSILEVVIELTNHIPQKKSTIIHYKNMYLMNIIKSDLFKLPNRHLLTSVVCQSLKSMFLDPGSGDVNQRKDVFRKAVFVYAEILDQLQSNNNELDDYEELCLLLPFVMDVFDDHVQDVRHTKSTISMTPTTTINNNNNNNNNNILNGVIAATMLILFDLIPINQLLQIFHKQNKQCLTLLMTFMTSIIEHDAFPMEWYNLTMTSIPLLLKMIHVVAMMMKQFNGLNELLTLLKLIQKIQLPKTHQSLCQVEMGYYIKGIWDNNKEIQLQLINQMMVICCQHSNSTLMMMHTSAVIINEILQLEFNFIGNIKRIKLMMMDLITTVDIKWLRLLNTEIMGVEGLKRELMTLMELKSNQLASVEDEYLECTLKLAHFMKSIGKLNTSVELMNEMANLQSSKNNFIEAGMLLMNVYMELEWGLQFEQKEALANTMIEYYVEGQHWELAIQLITDLIREYKLNTFEYKKLSLLLIRQSELYALIINKERFAVEYFRVGYYGNWGILRNKVYIYRGYEFEKISMFIERILNKQLHSVLLKSNKEPTKDILESELKYVQITTVQTEPDHELLMSNAHDDIKRYYKHNHLNKFSFSRPFKKTKTGNEFLDLWTEKTIYTTEDVFPHGLKKSLIVKIDKIEYSPIENALKTMIDKNKELLNLEILFTKQPTLNCNPLTMSLNGSVDAPVNGGVPMYKKCFLSDEFKLLNPDKLEFVNGLADAIDEQIIIISRCLEVHGKVVPTQMRPLHDNLIKMFIKNYSGDMERLQLPIPMIDIVISPDESKEMTLKKKDRGSSMALNEGGTVNQRLLNKAFGKKGGLQP